MNFLETWLINRYLRGLGERMGQNWMARFGAIGGMLGVLGLAITDISKGQMTLEKAMAYFTAFNLGLSQLGIRRAVGRAAAGDPATATTVDTKPPVPKL